MKIAGFYAIFVSVNHINVLIIEMTYTEFKNQIKDYPIFSTSQLSALGQGDSPTLRNQISDWTEKGLLVKLRNNLYVLNEHDRKWSPSRFFLATQIYAPSYVSGESAMGFYDLIPERVADITCVSTKKTAAFSNALGTFVYQHLKADCFAGFSSRRDDSGLPFLIAAPEKALIDHLYLNMKKFADASPDIFEGSLRLQNLEQLRPDQLTRWARQCRNKKLKQIVKDLCSFIRESR